MLLSMVWSRVTARGRAPPTAASLHTRGGGFAGWSCRDWLVGLAARTRIPQQEHRPHHTTSEQRVCRAWTGRAAMHAAQHSTALPAARPTPSPTHMSAAAWKSASPPSSSPSPASPTRSSVLDRSCDMHAMLWLRRQRPEGAATLDLRACANVTILV